MAIETFVPPIPPSPGTSNKPEFKVLEAEFGDGYTQAGADGLNNIRDVLSLEWETLTPAQAEAIITFIRRQYGARPFWYTPSNGVRQKWTCKEYTDKRGEGGLRTVTATFRQSFNLVT